MTFDETKSAVAADREGKWTAHTVIANMEEGMTDDTQGLVERFDYDPYDRDLGFPAAMQASPNGYYVRYSDYAALQETVKRLEAELQAEASARSDDIDSWAKDRRRAEAAEHRLAEQGQGEAVAWARPEVIAKLLDGRAANHVDLSKLRGGNFTEPLYATPPSPEPSNLDKWEIDNSTDSPILTYEKCSVIQDKQAHYVMCLIRRDAAEPTEAEVHRVGDILMQHGLNAPEQVIYKAARAALATLRAGGRDDQAPDA